MKTAIVYYSLNGNTAYAARAVAKELDADAIGISPEKQYPDRGIRKFFWGGKSAVMAETPNLKPYDFKAGEYDAIVFGFPVWASNIAPPLRTFVCDNLEALKGKRLSAFACQSGSGAEKAFMKLSQCLGVDSLAPTLILIDPKDRPNPDNEKAIRAFCDQIRGLNS